MNAKLWIPSVVGVWLLLLLTACGGGGGGSGSDPVSPPTVGPLGEVKLGGTTETPVIGLSSTAPSSGDTEIVTVSAPGASRIDLAVSGSGCGALTAGTSNTASLTKSGVVAASGQCLLMATVTTTDGSAVYTTEFTIMPRTTLAAQGISVTNGTYFPSGDPSLLPASSAVVAGSVSVSQALVNGGSASLYVTQAGSAVATKAIVQFSLVPGYYLVPLTWDAVTNGYRIDLQASGDLFSQRMPDGLRAMSEKPMVTATVNLIAPDGGISTAASTNIQLAAVGSGPIQVSLTWGGAVDADLHVTTPGGSDIYYDNRTDSTGGTLDLDSNAGCSIDNVNNENIVWTNSSTPVSGTYQVRVDYWSSCGNLSPIPYTVRVTNCGVSQTYSGVMTAEQADFGDSGSGFVVASINYQSCSGLSVAGTARYDDYQPTTSGLSTTARALPIRYAQVEVHKSSDDSVLATGLTNENGSYALTFSMPTPGKYYVKVLATQSLSWLPQKVVNTSGAIYAIKTPDQDASVTPNATGVDLNAKRNGSFAEAFNIFDLGVSAFKEVQARLAVTMPALTWRWTAGQATCGGAASCYSNTDNSIYVLSTAADQDEYDDTVLTHEFGHFVISQVSRDNSPGGAHGLNQQNVPTLAWSEGVATFLGQRMMQTPTYIDTNASAAGAFMYNIETVPSYVPTGTSDGTLSGNVSEALVSAVLWDLADIAQDGKTVGGTLYTDKISNPDAVYSVLKSWRTKSHDRGATGADLVDFIDEWLCSVMGATWEATPSDNFKGLITKLNGFPYAPAATPSCQ